MKDLDFGIPSGLEKKRNNFSDIYSEYVRELTMNQNCLLMQGMNQSFTEKMHDCVDAFVEVHVFD